MGRLWSDIVALSGTVFLCIALFSEVNVEVFELTWP
jgi:hypothetical protein